jgi:hypothetical protein
LIVLVQIADIIITVKFVLSIDLMPILLSLESLAPYLQNPLYQSLDRLQDIESEYKDRYKVRRQWGRRLQQRRVRILEKGTKEI